METVKTRKRALWFGIPAGALVAGAFACAAMAMMSPPKDLDLTLSKLSAGGIYRASIKANIEPITVGRMHSWTVSLNTAKGAPVDGASISVDGGMPQHGHGLPSVPKVTKYLGDGRYLVEGMKFNMPGWWIIKVEVDGAAGHDETVFNLVL